MLKPLGPAIFPWPHGDDLLAIGNRAQRLLAGRTAEQCASGRDGIRYMLEESDEVLIDHLTARADADTSERDVVRTSPAQMLTLYVEVFDIRGQDDFPEAHWSEYFALLALNSYNQGVEWASRLYNESDDADSESAQFERLGRTSIRFRDALEAVVIAEELAAEERHLRQREQQAKAQLSLLRRQAAHRRHEPLNQLKRECIQYWLDNSPPSFAEGARRFWATVAEERKHELRLRDPDRIFTQTLSEFARGMLPPHIWP